MSIKIIKPGLQATLVDNGRTGFGYIGIGAGGAMDLCAMKISNYLVGNEDRAATIEMNFPAPEILFNNDHLISVTGNGFEMRIDEIIAPMWKPFCVKRGSVLKLKKREEGSRTYLAVKDGWKVQAWLGSYTTNLGAQAGGFQGRALQKEDIIDAREFKADNKYEEVPWGISKNELDKIYSPTNEIRIVRSAEADFLSSESKAKLLSSSFSITNQSNRMGYRLVGEKLFLDKTVELVSSAVDFGTIQLLPDGNLIILMADHQTTGGYPRIASVIKPDLPKLAQMNPNDRINFKFISLKEAEDELIKRENLLMDLKQSCLVQYKNHFKV